ncbi:TerY-C metal binding domain-containing protein [Succinimonas sp.]|uniref:TerY-C metal binding domain-containing protein n=1 Tax=Succinimonas sp. TaxID=1936151 RepID=UPI00386F13DB
MRRLPIFFVIDVSESMAPHLQKVDNGLKTITGELSTDPYALETAFISTVVFAGQARVLHKLTEVYALTIPALPLGGGTDYGRAMDCLMDEIDRNVVKSTRDQKGDWKPIIFFFTDGNPTSDSYKKAFSRWNRDYRGKANIIAFSLGAKIDYSILGQITEQIYLLDNMDSDTVKSFFKWVSASIQTNSVAVGDNQELSDEKMMPDATSIEGLHKIDLRKGPRADLSKGIENDNLKVIIGKCGTVKRRYIILYEKDGSGYRELSTYKIPDEEMYDALTASGSGADFDIDKVTSTGGVCPYCGTNFILNKCSCGKIFCSRDIARELQTRGQAELTCPWCNNTGIYGYGSFRVGTGLG